VSDLAYDATRTALLVVDPYNDFLSEGGKLYALSRRLCRAFLPQLRQCGIASHARGRWFKPSRAHSDLQGFLVVPTASLLLSVACVAQSVAQDAPRAHETWHQTRGEGATFPPVSGTCT
jgi:hypothetical protein